MATWTNVPWRDWVGTKSHHYEQCFESINTFFFFFQKHKHQKFTYTPPVYPYSWILHIPNTHLLQMKQMNKELSSFHIQTSDCLCPFCPCVPFIQWSKAIFVLIWFYLYKLWRNAYYHLWLFFPDPLLKEISLYSWSLHRAEISRPLNKELSSFWWWWFSCWVKSDFYDPMDYSPPGSSIHGISQARILEWVAISLTRGSSQPRDWTHVSCNGRWILYWWASRDAFLNTILTSPNVTYCYQLLWCFFIGIHKVSMRSPWFPFYCMCYIKN